MDEEQIIQQFTESLRLGLKTAESGGDYSVKNKTGSSASGAYQFTEVWMDNNMKNVDSIRAYANKNKDLFNIQKDIKDFTLDDFRMNPELQDAYFTHYSRNFLYPKAKEIYSGKNPKNIPLEGVGALVHFKGSANYGRDHKNYDGHNTGAAYQVSTGDFDTDTKKGVNGAEDDNMSAIGYVNKVLKTIQKNKSLIDSGSVNTVIPKDDKSKAQIVEDFNKRNQAITDNKELTNGQKETKRGALYQEMVNKGYDVYVNEAKAKEFEGKRKEIDSFKNGETPGGYVSNLIEQNKDNFKINPDGSYELVVDGRSESELKTIRKKLKEKLPSKLYDQLTVQHDKINYEGKVENETAVPASKKLVIKGSSAVNFLEVPDKAYKAITGENLYLDVSNDAIQDANTPEDLKAEHSKRFGWGNVNDKRNTSNFKENYVGLTVNPKENLGSPNFSFLETESTVINREIFKPSNEEVVIDNVPNESESNSKEQSKSTNKENIDTAKKNQEAIEKDALENMYANKMSLADVNLEKATYGKTKRDMPLEAISGLVLGLKGVNDASKVNIPKRTETVSNLVNNYVAELAKMKNQGLTPQQEAQANNALAEAYSAGLENLKNNVGGNRAQLLGNTGRLDSQNMKGKLAIQLADIDAQQKAMQMYGQAVQYIDGVNINRDIANHGIAYQESARKRENAEQLGAAGFKKLIDGVENARLTGPGSAMDMYRSSMMQELFGFDPQMKDNGLGDIPGTKSFFDKNAAEKLNQGKVLANSSREYQALNPEQKKVANQFYAQNKDSVSAMKFVKTLAENPNLNLSSFNANKMNPNESDYTKLFQEANTIDLAPNELNPANDSLIEEPFQKMKNSNNQELAPLVKPEQETIDNYYDDYDN